MIVSELSTQVNDLLRPMGITRNLSAYSILCQCLELVCEQEDRLQAVEKDIYTPIADRRRCEPKAIQSAVRRAAKGAWLTNPEYVQQLAGYPLTGCPSAVPNAKHGWRQSCALRWTPASLAGSSAGRSPMRPSAGSSSSALTGRRML